MKQQLNQKIWDGDILRTDIQQQLMKIAHHFYEYLKLDIPILDIIFTGSLANFNYHSTSDIDLHILIDFNNVSGSSHELVTQLLRSKKDNYNTIRDIKVKGYAVELYAQDISEVHNSNGQYSILNNKWLIKPEVNTKASNQNNVMKISKIYKELIQSVDKLEDDELKLKLAGNIKNDIVQKRRDGLEAEGEYSTGNLVFKQLRKDEFYRLFDSMNKTTDRILSLEQKNNRQNF